MIADIDANKKISPIVTELALEGRKLSISLVFISQSYFKVPKTIRINATNLLIMKIPNKIELQQIASYYSPDIEFKYFVRLYKNYTKEPFSFLLNYTTLSSDNPLRFRKNLLQNDCFEKIKTINTKIEHNKTQYDLDRQFAKISALLSGNVDKYEKVLCHYQKVLKEKY